MTNPCASCEHHRAKSNPHAGKLIPNHHGKCIRPEGLCDAALEHQEAMRQESSAFLDDGPVLTPEITEERGAELAQMQNTAAVVDQAVMDAEEIFRDLGRLDATLFYATVTDSMLVQIFQKIKKSKAYKNIPIRDEAGNLRRSENLEEFCRYKLGKSYSRLHELSQNMAMLGSDLYESAERIGFRAKDYRALKALPEDQQAIVKQAMASESKEEVFSILEDMAARHQAEKEAARKEKDDLTADLEARSRLLEDKSQKLEQTEQELYKLKSLPPDANLELKLAREEEAVKEIDQACVAALAEFNQLVRQIDAITTHDEVSLHTKRYVVQTVQMYCEGIQAALSDYAIPVDFEEMVNPSWMREEAKADLEDGKTEDSGVGRSW